MKRVLLSIMIVILLCPMAWAGDCCNRVKVADSVIRGPIMAAAGDYCSGTAWNTLTSFRLDFDHTTDTKTACTAGGTELGATTGTPGIANPSPVSPGSGANAIVPDATAEYITFSNSGTYFTSKWGEFKLLCNLAGNNANDYTLLSIVQTAYEDRIQFLIQASGLPLCIWEDNNNGTQTCGMATFDMDSYYGKWVQFHIRWDTTRCAGSPPCDAAGEQELGIRARVYDGGWGAWSAWEYNSTAVDLHQWAAEPTTNDFKFGLVEGAFDAAVWVDDVEISNAQPSWD